MYAHIKLIVLKYTHKIGVNFIGAFFKWKKKAVCAHSRRLVRASYLAKFLTKRPASFLAEAVYFSWSFQPARALSTSAGTQAWLPAQFRTTPLRGSPIAIDERYPVAGTRKMPR